MSQATRCSACGTVFRVVDDQLKISDGWVRCGRCNTVFDALESMVDLEQQRLESGDAAAMPIHQLLERQDDFDQHPAASELPAGDEPDRLQALDIDLDEPDGGAPLPPAAANDHRPNAAPPADERPAAAAAVPVATVAAVAPPASPSTQRIPAATVRTRPSGPPSFMRQAERQQQWSSPAMRAALIGTSLILLLMLMLQVVYHQRDSIAASSAPAADWMRSACARWNCSIEAPRSIRDVTIENSALTKLAGQPNAARLSLRMRNRSGTDLAMPAVELSLTDFEGRLIARRALLPSDFQVDPPIVTGQSELPVQIIVSAGENRIAGYTVELFYP